MFCPLCGNPHDPAAQFCAHCGSRLGAPPTPYAVGDSPAAVAAAPALAAPEPSYIWGYIQGWGALVGSPLLFLLFLAVYFAPDSDHDTRLGAAVLMLLCAFGIVLGFALVRKLKLGLILVYVITGLHVLLVPLFMLATLAPQHPPETPAFIVAALVGLGFWAACSLYYYRRRAFLH